MHTPRTSPPHTLTKKVHTSAIPHISLAHKSLSVRAFSNNLRNPHPTPTHHHHAWWTQRSVTQKRQRFQKRPGKTTVTRCAGDSSLCREARNIWPLSPDTPTVPASAQSVECCDSSPRPQRVTVRVTGTRHHRPPATGHRPPATGHQSPATGSPVTGH